MGVFPPERWGLVASGGNRGAEFVRALREVLDSRARRERDVIPSRVVGRDTDGRTLLLGLDGECISPGGSSGYDGEIVTTLPSLLNRDGTAGVRALSQSAATTILWVESISPSIFSQGASALSVTVTGRGFTSSTVFQFLQPASEEVNDDITIVSSTYVDPETFTLVINVAADATPIVDAPLAYDDPSRRFL